MKTGACLTKVKLLGIGTAALLVLLSFSSAGQTAPAWAPSKPVEVMVSASPGGASDVFARSIAKIIEAEKLSPFPLVVINRPGGGGTIGTTAVAKQKGNPYSLVTYQGAQMASAMITGKQAATFRDLTMIACFAIDEQLIYVRADSSHKTIEDVVSTAKQRPGTLTIGGTFTGVDDHMCTVLFERAAGIKFRYVPFNSGGDCVTALLGGHVDMIWANPGETAPQYDAKMVRPLAVAKENRMSEMPSVPTFKEKGYNLIFMAFRGMAAPPEIPPEVIGFYENMFKRMSESARWKEEYLKRYLLSPTWMGSQEFAVAMGKMEGVYTDILKDLGILK